MSPQINLEQLSINTVRILAADAVQKANSGHPGTPMALAPVGYVLWTSAMRYNPQNPDWPGRDRFILSAGHACMLQYAFLYLTGYDLTMDDIKQFRQLHSKTPGHPEYGLTKGIEATTGPLGQGFANGVGMAIAQQYLAARYNKENYPLFDYNIYAICSDGDLMEGISAEAASLAGHLQLGSLVYLYDNNHISIEGNTSLAFDREDVGKRFEAYGWHVQYVDDANNIQSLKAALQRGREEKTQPSLIIVRSHIGYGSPNKVDKASAHGSPLGEDEVKLVKQNLNFDPEQSFVVPDDVLKNYRDHGKKGAALESKWNELFEKYAAAYPELAREYTDLSSGKLPEGWDKDLPTFKADEKIATRKASGKMLNAIADKLPWLIGGSADLAPSTDTMLENYDSFSASNRSGRNFHFGVREHAMGAVLNGIALTKGFIPYGATFLIFSDYMKPPVRLSAIMEIKPVFIYTHDSIGLGEDGTTHQPVEQLLSLRAIPNMTVIRPADANETVQAWRVALQHEGGPVAIVLTRQNIPVIDQDKYAKATNLEKGAYILSDAEKPSLLLIATGSEVQLALKAQELLKAKKVSARVISMPSWELFNKQDQAYKDAVFPPSLRKRIAIEAATSLGWQQYVTEEGTVIGVDKFGTSAPAEDVFKAYGITAEHVVEVATKILK